MDIPESVFQLVHVFHRKGTETPFLALCFKADITNMDPQNNEPQKHGSIKLFNIDFLPKNIIPAHEQAIQCIKRDISYAEHG